MAVCANCGKNFSPSRGDARYCSNRCRLVTFREGVELATIVKRHLSFGTTLDGDTDDQLRLRELMNVYPDAFRKLGEPLIRAALGTTMPLHGCRWDLACMYAIRLDQPKPRLSRAGRTLLGNPCPGCERRMQPKRQSQSSGGAVRGAERVAVERTPGTYHRRTASPDPRKQGLHDPLGTCKTCADYQRAFPAAALTAVGVPEGCPPHAWGEQPKARRPWMR